MLSIIWTIECTGREKAAAGFRISPEIMYGKASVCVGHAFNRRWSAEADISINAGRLTEGASEEEKGHWKELYSGLVQQSGSIGNDLVSCGISFLFWTRNIFDGPLISIGGCVKDRSGPALTAGIGYYCRIWKGLCAVITYRTEIISPVNMKNNKLEGLNIGISYVF